MQGLLHNSLLEQFRCTGDACPDTCCKQWSMQVDDGTLERYRTNQPSLLESVAPDESGGVVMRRNELTGYCVKFEDGICAIHKNLGDRFLGDACHFYPRATRQLGHHTLMTATLSCPEITRLAVVENNKWDYTPAQLERLPTTLKDYAPENLSADDALAVHKAFLEACDDETASPTRIFARIASVSRSFDLLGQDKWAAAVSFYLRMADGRLPTPQPEENDPFNLLHALCGLIVATKKPRSERLQRTLDDITNALQLSVNWSTMELSLSPHSQEASQQLQAKWSHYETQHAPLLRRWLKMQLALSLFPFSGLGDNVTERITIIGVRFATLKLAITCACVMNKDNLDADGAVRVVQTLSRVLDHLGDSRFSLAIYTEAQWLEEARMLGLLNL